ncbi:mannanase [Coprinopsis marcescibilis]|uniref:mannan endo-1,4-beta-mannosidase n=1 Tax=Coprinopsis marcescibilis TaxID=230819 RepID=A0A5C3KEM0_COPMA|nr:mannanase [Coprinopsis marcescibilis]
MHLQLWSVVALQVWLASAVTLVARNNGSTGFVSVKNGRFNLDGSLYRFYGTNAYWVHMTTDYDLELTFHDIAAAGFNVVRTWAHNDVSSKPASGPYFQILSDGKGAINEGEDGLKRLDKVVATAQKYGIKLLLTLTNNWNPARPIPKVAWNRRANTEELPRGFLSNDYGGIDAYVRAFNPDGAHDLFYTDRAIIDAFKNYVSHVVKRYAKSPAVLGWELGNDLRCSSTVPSSPNCNTATITNWAAEISSYIKTLDTNHLITPGDGGFYCLNCPKKFAKEFTKPSPSLPGRSFDGSYGVDTEDLIAIPDIDFGSFQLFPDQTEYFPSVEDSFATKAIGDGGKWVAVHSNTATLLGKPEALTAAAIIPKEHYSSFAPFNSTSKIPDGTPCGGVEPFQVDFAFTSWANIALHGNVSGVLEYQWQQSGLTSHGTIHENWEKRALTESPQDGSARYNGPANGQNADQFAASLPPLD